MKTTLTKVMLVLLPFVTAALATTGDSVKLVNMATGEVTYASYFELLPASSLQLAPPLAGMCAILCVILAALYVFMKKDGLLQGARWTAFAGACFAVLPNFLKSESMMLPNIGVPLMLMAQFLLCTYAKKHPLEEKPAEKAPRLEPHR